MRNKKLLFFIMIYSALLCNSGCINNTSDNGQEYTNLSYINNFSIEQPDLQKIDTFEMTIKPNLSMEALYDLFDRTVERYYPNKFSKKEKELLYDVNGVDQYGNQLSRTEYDEKGNPIIGGYNRNKDYLLSGDVPTPWLWFNSDRGMIQMYPNGSLQSVTCDVAYKLDYPDGKSVGMYCAADENLIVDRVHIPSQNFKSDYSYHLMDKDYSLDEAVLSTKTLLQDSDKGIANEKLIADVTDAWIVDMGDGIYGYHFWLTSTYDGIRLDTSPMKNGLISHIDDSKCNHKYDLFPGYAFMIESSRLDSIMTFGFRRAYLIDNIKQQETIISYKEAEKKLSESLSSASKIELSRAEFVYTPYFDNDGQNNEHLYVDSAWKFVGKNQNDGCDYVFYVDSSSGEVEYYKY